MPLTNVSQLEQGCQRSKVNRKTRISLAWRLVFFTNLLLAKFVLDNWSKFLDQQKVVLQYKTFYGVRILVEYSTNQHLLNNWI